MRILISQRELMHFDGSEMVTVEVSRTLAARGHEVVVYSPRIGDVAKLLLPGGIATISALRDAPWTPDIIHGQHHLTAMAAMARFPSCPAIYHCHGTQPWVERSPSHDRIRKYVMMCEWMVLRTQTELGLEPGRVVSVPNFINTTRFSEVRTTPQRFRKALLFGGAPLGHDELALLESACAATGITLDKIGAAFGNPKSRPEIFLQDYDLVFAIGKCALEALATGCAVIPLIPGQAGGLVTPATFDDWAFSNFGPRYYMSSKQLSEDWLRHELALYAPSDLAAVTQRVRRERTLDGAVDTLEAIYAEVLREEWSAQPGGDAFGSYLEWLAPEVDQMWRENLDLPRLRVRISDMEEQLSQSTARESILQNEVAALLREKAGHGTMLGVQRRLWAKLKSRLSRSAVS